MVQIYELLGNKEIMNILDFFISNSVKEFSQTDVRKYIKISKTTLIKWIHKMEKLNLLKMRKIGNSNLYKLNNEDYIVKQIKILKTLLELKPLRKIKADAYLYGSAARGEDIEDSDIDLLFIGKINRRSIIEEIDNLSKKINKNINFKIFNKIEWLNIARKDKAFYERVEKDKIRIR